jgi:thiol-disulfide isomerase/thioredoxin
MGAEMPSFDGATEWVNGQGVQANLLGKPSIVYFWAMSCHICEENMPTLEDWREKYGDRVNFIAFHRPRQESDTNVEDVKKAIATHKIVEPVGIDNTHEVGDRFETGQYWPYYFLFDAEGKMKSRAAGDVGLAQIEKALERLLAES